MLTRNILASVYTTSVMMRALFAHGQQLWATGLKRIILVVHFASMALMETGRYIQLLDLHSLDLAWSSLTFV